MPRFLPPALGWHRDLPDSRDFGPGHAEVAPMLTRLQWPAGRARKGRPTSSVCWEEYFAPIESQECLNASSAYAVASMIGYYERRAFGRQFDGSALFLYKMSRLLAQWTGDSGATLRDTIRALARFGIPPRRFWADRPDRFDDEPAAFLFSYAREYERLRYIRLDPPEQAPEKTLATVRAFLASGFTVAFGVSLFDSLGDEAEIVFPAAADTALGGQALVAVGYDDKIGTCSGPGALRVRASWGAGWGESGYGWLPYTHVVRGLAVDFWTILRPDWVENGEFTPIVV